MPKDKSLNDNLKKLDDMLIHKAPHAKLEIDAKADAIANALGGTVAKAPIKSKERALEKMMNDYSGEAGELKDLARNTIIVPNHKIDDAVEMLKAEGAKVKVIDGKSDDLGYSGVNSTLKTESGIRAEIQVNSPEMIYAKEPKNLAKTLLGHKQYDEIATKVGLEGGKGHQYYEAWRKLDPNTPKAKQIATESKRYYTAVRDQDKELVKENKHLSKSFIQAPSTKKDLDKNTQKNKGSSLEDRIKSFVKNRDKSKEFTSNNQKTFNTPKQDKHNTSTKKSKVTNLTQTAVETSKPLVEKLKSFCKERDAKPKAPQKSQGRER